MSQLSRVSTDQKLIDMWLHNRPETTAAGYRRNAEQFLEYLGKPIGETVLEDLQGYLDHLKQQGLKESSQRTKLNNVKSLFTFATKLNYCRFNVAAALRVGKHNKSVSDKILSQREVFQLIEAAAPGRDRNLIKLIYATGIRVSEACSLRWSSFRERDDGTVQMTVLGKGSKQRSIVVPLSVWVELVKGKEDEEIVFQSNRGKPLDRVAAHKIIKSVVEKAGINSKTSTHWLRHSHCTHALNKGAPIALVRDSMGHSSIAITDIYTHSNPSDSSSNYLDI